ncbi:hypothetical protein E2562_018178 [Oryza meyeriana var. granulata]|uniref:Uncharacterized protein n=1 Tax=Oryza meyeriana var. granulata TaxID=110450 RepID=A0A6G1C7P7_9ORYZ|nr:hypothetical protein E2562_018178 [Oryza meyeriana var. granulata]
MTDWKFTGSLPPMSDEEWQLEFEKYKLSPEYKRVNKGMSLEDFKFIYWMEYGHRMWGRALGFLFSVPFAYFIAKGYVTCQLGLRLLALFALGAGQGLIGWWMVKSGLEEPASEYVQPRVSPYRLATHLTSAFVIYCGILWTALSVVMPEPPAGSMNWVNSAAKIKKLAIPVSAVVGITAISGAFVAGNDAGHAYNTFPKMGDTWIPEDVFTMEPFIRNFFENTSTVQRPPGVFEFPWQKCRGGLGVPGGGGSWELRDVFFRSLVDGRAAAIGVPGDRLFPPPSKRALFDDVDAWLAAAGEGEVDPVWRSVLEEGARPAA